MVNTVYDPDLAGDPAGIAAKLSDKTTAMYVFHAVTALGAVLMLVFAAGLLPPAAGRRCPTASSRPSPSAGSLGTAFVSVLGSGLDTEFMMACQKATPSRTPTRRCTTTGSAPSRGCGSSPASPGSRCSPAYRQGGVPRWIGRVGLVLGGLTVLLGVSPLEYMSGVTGALWLLATALGFTLGDRAPHRGPLTG